MTCYVVYTERSTYRLENHSEGVFAKRTHSRAFPVSEETEPLYPGVIWKKGDNGELLIIDEKGRVVLKTTRIVKMEELK